MALNRDRYIGIAYSIRAPNQTTGEKPDRKRRARLGAGLLFVTIFHVAHPHRARPVDVRRRAPAS
jgi:hypothetical protein